MNATGPGERLFTAADTATLFAPGIVVAHGRRRVWHPESDPAAAVRAAMDLSRRAWPDAVVLVPENARLAQASLALAFAQHLHEVRRRRELYGACVTSPSKPPLPRGNLFRVPHLVTMQEPQRGCWSDTVVWEVMTRDRIRAWLGQPSQVLAGLEEQVPALLALRGAVRENRLPDTPDAQKLRNVLQKRYLSIRLVLEHRPLFDALIARTVKEAHL
ncbi:hypothetical protein ABZ897_43405 [Nonomuraea sp. NPDC046802]|uniref:hypothetical protein n=1 Tax=Nonomuraea sp. NPDC046802 TaxID=3154919 RepID=UPI0033E7D3D5